MPLLILCLLGPRQPAAAAQEGKDPLPGFEKVLEWLPEDTETLVVSNGPFQFAESSDKPTKPLPLAKTLEGVVCYPFGMSPEGGKKLVGREATLAVEGARKFRGPKSLGMWHYEGCHILVLKSGLDDSWSKALAAGATKVQKISGHDVHCFEKKQGIPPEDPWTYYFVHPKPNVLLCATDSGYLTETLQRMDQGGAKRALPDDLPEWKQVDRTARFWAIRHYTKPRAGEPIESPHHLELVASGFTFSFNPAKEPETADSLKIKYLTDNEAAKAAIEKLWNFDPTALSATVQQGAPGITEVTAKFAPDKPELFGFLLLANLGHVVAL
jgi:hypothetical protein